MRGPVPEKPEPDVIRHGMLDMMGMIAVQERRLGPDRHEGERAEQDGRQEADADRLFSV